MPGYDEGFDMPIEQPQGSGNWTQYSHYVLRGMLELKRKQEILEKRIADAETQVAVMWTKITIYGGGAGFALGLLGQIAMKYFGGGG